jgi:hypothetical protein
VEIGFLLVDFHGTGGSLVTQGAVAVFGCSATSQLKYTPQMRQFASVAVESLWSPLCNTPLVVWTSWGHPGNNSVHGPHPIPAHLLKHYGSLWGRESRLSILAVMCVNVPCSLQAHGELTL